MEVPWPPRRSSRGALDEFLKAALSAVADRATAATATWQQRAIAVARQFADVRLAREHAIAAGAERTAAMFQAGLFDRRAERQQLADRAMTAASVDDAARRIGIAERAGPQIVSTPRLLLVLAP